MNKIDLKDKIAVITGGAQGFGYAIAKRFISSNAKVIILDNDPTAIAEAIDLKEIKFNDSFETDIANYNDVAKTIKEIINKYSQIDIFINNAGIAGPSFKTWEYPNDDWNSVIDIDLNGTFNCCKAITPYMI